VIRLFTLKIFLLVGICASAQNIDIDILNKINSPVNEHADKRWKTYSDLNPVICIATPVTMFTVGLFNKDKELKTKSYESAASLVLASLITEGLKITVNRTRPYVEYPDLIYKKATPKGASFPSGHTSTAFATATSLSLAFPKWYVIIPSYGYATAMAYSRMYLGVHYPSDVIIGAIIGFGSSFLVFEMNKMMNKN
jgi:membrane-associated phospholipid phosphatase